MDSNNIALDILSEIEKTISMIKSEDVEFFIGRILKAKRIFILGAGRTMLMLRAFAMRLMHMGLNVYIVGDTVTPAISRGDLLVIGSGTGETEGLVIKAKKAKNIGAEIFALTIFNDSSIASLGNFLIIPGATNKVKDNIIKSRQPGANLFEQSLLILLDAVTMQIAGIIGIDVSKPSALHANLE